MKSKTFNYDSQGWPEKSMSFRDIIAEMGAVLNEKTGKYEIPNNESLDEVPVILHDDGFGYGVDAEYIHCVGINEKDSSVIFFADRELPYVEIWEQCNMFPSCSVEYEGNTLVPIKVEKKDDGMYFVFYYEPINGERVNKNKTISLPVETVQLLRIR